MKFTTLFVSGALLALAHGQAQVPCAGNATLPCICPAGTVYQESGTFLITGVNIVEIKATLGDFFNAKWLKRPLIKQEGSKTVAGAKRTLRTSTAVGVYDFTEVLTSYQEAPDQSFKLTYELASPVKFQNGKGQFAGWWQHAQSENAFPYEAPLRWSLFACVTGHPIDFAGFAEARLNDLVRDLKAKGVAKGDTLGPLSFQRF